MRNYWLSEYQSPDDEEMPEEPEMDDSEDEEEDMDDPKSKLNARKNNKIRRPKTL